MQDEKINIFDDSASKDETLPLDKLLAEMKETTTNTVEQPKIEEPTVVDKVSKKDLSPLEQMKKAKERVQSGMVVSNDELKKGESKAPEGNIIYNDERMTEIQESIDSYDETMRKRNAVVVTKEPQNQFEYVQLITEIDSVTFDADGKAHFNLTDLDGNPSNEEPKFCRLRKEDEEIFDYSNIKEFPKEDTTDKESSEEDDISEEKKKTVQVIIDKTGLGTDFIFTDEEKKKITDAETIRVNEVKVLDLATIKSKRSDKSFQDVIKKYDVRGSRTTICFPASGFKAQMKGLTYGEYADVALSMENVTFDQYYKRLSIIYNKMINISTGPFKDFEDFLKHFAYTDIPLAVYAMFVSTEAEEQEIALHCGNEDCDKTFNWTYNTRSILRLERCADNFLAKMQELASASAMDYDKIRSNSAVENSKVIELPDSKFVVEMGIASAYDFLYNFIPLMNEKTFKEAFGDDLNQVYMDNVLLLTTVRSVYIPNEDGTYIECTGYKDILDALYNISPTEIQILAAYTGKLQSKYEVTFSFGNVTCPHCKNVTKNLDINVDDLVFQTYQRLMSTEIDLSKFQDL